MTLDLFDEAAILRGYVREVRNPLRAEMQAAASRMTPDQARKLQAMGIPVAHLLEDASIGVVKASVDAKDFWTPEETGRTMIAVPLIEDGHISDLIAFDPNEPAVWYLRTGTGWALGAENIAAAVNGWSDREMTLLIHSTPMNWLRAGCEGCCVSHWTDEARATIRHVKRIAVTSTRLAQYLRLELTRPPRIPEIEVRGMRSRAA